MSARDTITRLRAMFTSPVPLAPAPAAAPSASAAAGTCEHRQPLGAKCLHCEAEADQWAFEQTRNLPRAPDGHIDNCAIWNGEMESSCQMCRGQCPDGALIAERVRVAVEADLGAPVPPPAVRGSATSVEAADQMSLECISADERTVFRAVADAGNVGMTDDELEVQTGLIHQTVSARRNGLVQKRRLRNSGLVRPTRSGRPAIVWVVGEGIPVTGAPNRRAPARPDAAELRLAAQHLLGNSDAIDRVRTWLLALAEQ